MCDIFNSNNPVAGVSAVYIYEEGSREIFKPVFPRQGFVLARKPDFCGIELNQDVCGIGLNQVQCEIGINQDLCGIGLQYIGTINCVGWD